MSKEDVPNAYFKYSTLGFNLLAGMIIFSLIGNWIDRKRGMGQTWTLVGMFLGLFYGGYEVWKFIKLTNEENQSSQPDKPKSLK